jgi:heme A synthase
MIAVVGLSQVFTTLPLSLAGVHSPWAFLLVGVPAALLAVELYERARTRQRQRRRAERRRQMR